jgi:hypothetical protein
MAPWGAALWALWPPAHRRLQRDQRPCPTLGLARGPGGSGRVVVQPAGMPAAFEALEQVMAAQETQPQAVQLALEKARYEAQRARRHSDRVDPDNRLVAGALAHRWNEACVRVAEVEARLATLARQRVTIDAEQRQRFQHLGDDLAVGWQQPAASVALKKRMVRTVLQESIIDTTPEPPEHRLTLHWHGGVPPERRVPRHRVGPHRSVTAPKVLALIGALSKVCQDQTSAATLHRLGYRTAPGKTWRAHSGARRRSTHRLPHVTQGQEGLPLAQAAPQLGVRATVLRRLSRHGTLPARQGGPVAPWILHASALALLAVQTQVQAVQVGHRAPGCPRQPAGPGQVSSPAGDAQAITSPAEACRRKRMAGEPCWLPCVSPNSSDVCYGGWRPRSRGPVA